MKLTPMSLPEVVIVEPQVFRDRLLGFLAEVVAGAEADRVPPPPHVAIGPREDSPA